MKTLKAAMQTSVTDLQLEWRLSGADKLVQVPSEMPPIFSGDRLIIYAINAGQQVRCLLCDYRYMTISENIYTV